MLNQTLTTDPPRSMRGAFVAMLMFVAALAMAVGNPLLWLWIGSKVTNTHAPQSGAYALVAGGLVVGTLAIGHVMGILSQIYNRAVGAEVVTTRAAAEPWHMTQRVDPGHKVMTTVLMVTIIPSMIAFTVWFLFFAGSPLPG